MKNNRAFTLVEVLAVIVILSILVLVAVPIVTKYMINSEQKIFVDDARRAVGVVRSDVLSNGFTSDSSGQCTNGTKCEYDQEAINSLLNKKLIESPFGGYYKGDTDGKGKNGSIKITVTHEENGPYVFAICMIDDGGNGFVNKTEGELKADSVSVGSIGDNVTCDNPEGSTYTVKISVSKGGYSVTTKTVNSGSVATFYASPDAGYGNPNIECTNGLTATHSGETLTTAPVNTDSTCTVEFTNLCSVSNPCTKKSENGIANFRYYKYWNKDTTPYTYYYYCCGTPTFDGTTGYFTINGSYVRASSASGKKCSVSSKTDVSSGDSCSVSVREYYNVSTGSSNLSKSGCSVSSSTTSTTCYYRYNNSTRYYPSAN